MSIVSRPWRVLVSLLLALVGLTSVGMAPAAAHRPYAVDYVALGDSYAAGQGAGSYRNACLQSDFGYPELIDLLRRVDLTANASCTGATTSDVINEQISALSRRTRLVTLTVGGNDLNVAGVAAACTTGTAEACQAAIDSALDLLTPPPTGGRSELARRLIRTYTKVAARAPKATILVTGYPYLFETPTADTPNAATIRAINDATTVLNQTIRDAVAARRFKHTDLRYVDVTAVFAGHGIGSAVPFINAAGPDAFHPNVAGYVAYAAAIRDVLTHRP